MVAVACDCCPWAMNVTKEVVQCGWLVCHMQHVVDCQFNNTSTLVPTSSINAAHMDPNCTICSQACLAAMCKRPLD